MNADISYNERRANEACIIKARVLAKVEVLADRLSVEIPEVDVPPCLCEENTWLATLDAKLAKMLTEQGGTQ